MILLKDNPGEPRLLDGGKIEWLYQVPTVVSGAPVERLIEVFNGGLSGDRLTLSWSGHWDAPDGAVTLQGGEIACEIAPGFHGTIQLAFTVPAPGQDRRRL